MSSVLVFDDDADLLEMVYLTLSANGFDTIAMSDGKSFFDAVNTIRPDLILLDIFLGDIDGRTLCRFLKTQNEFQDIPVILYSAGNIPQATIKESLANAFISKPFDIKLLISNIKSLVKKES
jgi:DNA-binding response OmpR family regulator